MNKKIALILACASFAAAVSACNESVEWTDCNFYSKDNFCANNNVMKCENSLLITVKECSENEVCSNGECVVPTPDPNQECSSNETRCIERNGVAVVDLCVDGAWVIDAVDCNGKICDTEHIMCIAKMCEYTKADGTKVSLADEEKTCDGEKLVQCVYPTATASDCEMGACTIVNEQATCAASTCTLDGSGIELAHGGSACVDGGLVTCNDGEASEPAPCEAGYVCRDGEMACDAGKDCDGVKHLSRICNADHDVYQCNDGALTLVEDCDTDNENVDNRTYCSSALKCETASADSCAPNDETGNPLIANGDYWCDGNVRRQCVNKVILEGSECSGETPYCDTDTNECRAYNVCDLGDGYSANHKDPLCLNDSNSAGYCDDGIIKIINECDINTVCIIDDTNTATCICDTKNHWIPEADTCVCDAQNRYVEIGGRCAEVECTSVADCPIDVPVNGTGWGCSESNQCELLSCFNGFERSSDRRTCVCEGSNKVVVGGLCVTQTTCDTNKEVYVKAMNACVCDYSKHFVGTAKACTCENGYVLVGNECQLKATCDATKEVYDEATNACSCNTADHWAGSVGSCACDAGYVEVNGKCVEKTSCDTNKEVYVEATNACACDYSKHFVGTAKACTCENGYVLVGNVCQPKATCDATKEVYDAEKNICSCNAADHWVGSVGSCACASGYVELNGKCVKKTSCDENKEVYVEGANACACDYSKHFVGSANACACENGYVLIGKACQLKATCDPVKEIYDEATNTCSCNTADRWVGSAGSCACTTGFTEVDGKCTRLAIESCSVYTMDKTILLNGSPNKNEYNWVSPSVTPKSNVAASDLISKFIVGKDDNAATWKSYDFTIKNPSTTVVGETFSFVSYLTGTMLDAFGGDVGDYYYTLAFSADDGNTWQYCGQESDKPLNLAQVNRDNAFVATNDVLFGFTFEDSSFKTWDGTKSYKSERGNGELSLSGTTKPTCINTADVGTCSIAHPDGGHTLALNNFSGGKTTNDSGFIIKMDAKDFYGTYQLQLGYNVKVKRNDSSTDALPEDYFKIYYKRDSGGWNSLDDGYASTEGYVGGRSRFEINLSGCNELSFLFVPYKQNTDFYFDDIYLYSIMRVQERE